MRIKKPRTYRNKAYLKYIRNLPCLVCGRPAVPHHVETGGTAMKCSDYRTIPLCQGCHTSSNYAIHKLGKSKFEKEFNIDINREMIKLLEDFIELEILCHY